MLNNIGKEVLRPKSQEFILFSDTLEFLENFSIIRSQIHIEFLMDIFIKSKLVPNTFFKQAVLPERPQALASACAVYNTFTLNSNPENKMTVTVSSYGTG